MKTSNVNQGRAHPEAIIRGWVSNKRAGPSGITVGDGSTSASDIWDVTVIGGTWTDLGGGRALLTIDTSDLGWFDVRDYGALGDGTTDDTVAIQDAIDAAYAAGGGTIYFPPGVYIVAGALQDTGAFNGQLLLPNVPHADLQITLVFKGALRPPFHPSYNLDVADFVGSGYSVIRSTLTGASGTAAMISGGNDTTPGFLGGTATNLEVWIDDLITLTPDNPTFTAWNLAACQAGGIGALQISTPGAFAGSPVQPTHNNQYGIKLPQVYFSNETPIDTLSVGGQYHQVLDGELCDYHNLILGPGIYGIQVPDRIYASTIRRLQATAVQSVIVATGSDPRKLDVLSYVRESQTGTWAETDADLDDATNLIEGYIRWQCTVTGGTAATFISNGGANVLNEEMGPQWGGGGSSGTTHYEILMASGSADPLVTSDGLDYLYVEVS